MIRSEMENAGPHDQVEDYSVIEDQAGGQWGYLRGVMLTELHL